MFRDQKVIVVMPAYNAEKTLRRVYTEVRAQDYVDQVIIVDDASSDQTLRVAGELPEAVLVQHPSNRGYGANQKTCYREALRRGADIVVMVHPDYQYSPQLIPALVSLIGSGFYDCVLGSRVLGGHALRGGMPLWRYVSNRFLTLAGNLGMDAKLSEFHTGYRAFSRRVLEDLVLEQNSDDFVFDNQMLAQILWDGFLIGEISCPTRYFAEASSISFWRSVRYGFGCLSTALEFRLALHGLIRSKRFPAARRQRHWRDPGTL